MQQTQEKEGQFSKCQWDFKLLTYSAWISWLTSFISSVCGDPAELGGELSDTLRLRSPGGVSRWLVARGSGDPECGSLRNSLLLVLSLVATIPESDDWWWDRDLILIPLRSLSDRDWLLRTRPLAELGWRTFWLLAWVVGVLSEACPVVWEGERLWRGVGVGEARGLGDGLVWGLGDTLGLGNGLIAVVTIVLAGEVCCGHKNSY